MRIRLMRRADISTAAAIVDKNYSRKYQKLAANEFKAMFTQAVSHPIYFVAEEHGEVIGLAGYVQSWMDYGVYELFWVNVAPERQSHGIGTKLVSRVIRAIRQTRDSRLIILTADASRYLPTYYAKRFGFKSLRAFSDTYRLMALSLQ
jgi:predicted N-acetyltransferase YhbS